MACTTIGLDRVEVIDQGGHWLHNTTTWPCIKVQLKLRTGHLKQNIGILRNRERFSQRSVIDPLFDSRSLSKAQETKLLQQLQCHHPLPVQYRHVLIVGSRPPQAFSEL